MGKKFQLTHITTKRFKVHGGLLYLSIITLFSIGFSSWLVPVENISQKLEMNVEAGNVLNLLKLNSSAGNYNICKYGFVDSNDQIVSTCLYSWSSTFYQANARKCGYINNENETNFYINISDRSTNSFINLYNNAYFSCVFYVTYNNTDSTQSPFSLSNNVISSTVSLTGIDDNETSEITFNVLLEFNNANASSLETTLNSYNYNNGLSFNVSIGVEATL